MPCRPGFLRMLRDIDRFNRAGRGAVADGQTVGDLVGALGLGDGFRPLYLRPFCGAIWSTPGCRGRAIPATLLVRFFRNHGLLGLTGQHQWWTVSGGSSRIRPIASRARLADGRRAHPDRRCRCRASARDDTGVDGACRRRPRRSASTRWCSPATPTRRCALLARPTRGRAPAARRDPLPRRTGRCCTRDPGQMPRRRACWSAWVYRRGRRSRRAASALPTG